MKVKPGAAGAPLHPPDGPRAPSQPAQRTPAPASTASPTDALEPENRATLSLDGLQSSAGTIWQYHAPPMAETSAQGLTVNWDGATAAATAGTASATASAARAQGSAAVTSGAVTGGLSVSEGQNELSVGYKLAGVSGAPTVAGAVGSWKGALALGVSASGSLKDVTGLAALYGTADRGLTLLGPYEGSEPTLQGTYQVEVKRELFGMGIFNLSRLAGSLGLSGGLVPSGAKATRLRTHVPNELARTLALEPKGVVGFLRDKARAVSLLEEPVPLPRLDQPELLKVGDEVGVRTSGALSLGVAAGSFGLPVGAQVTAQGDFELEVKKPAADQVELTVTPVRVRGAMVSAGLPLVGDFSAQLSSATALSQSFTFDLREPDARAAYLLALEGKLPGQVQLADGKKATASVRGEQLPQGVTRRFADRMSATQRTLGASVSLAFVQRGGPVGGLGTYFSSSSGTRTLTDGATTASFEQREVQRRREVLLSGTEHAGVRATRRTLTTFDAEGNPSSAFGGVRLLATFSDDKVRGLEFNAEVVDSINGLFGLEAKPMERKRQGQGWQVSLSRTLGEAELAALATPSPARLSAATATGLTRGALNDFVKSLQQRDSTEERAERVLTFISKEGMAGFAAVHALLGGEPAALEVERVTDAYSAPLQQLQTFSLVHPARFEATHGAKALQERFGDAAKLVERLDGALADLSDDPFPSSDTQAVRARLEAGVLTAKAAVSVAHLSPKERRALHQELGSGWVTQREFEAQLHLEAAGLS